MPQTEHVTTPSSGATILKAWLILAVLVLLNSLAAAEPAPTGIAKFELTPGPLEYSGAANSWRFINAVGEESGIWGFENGRLEGWVYPLKLFHDFNLQFQMQGDPRIYSGPDLVRSVRVFPHMVQLQYSAEGFTVRQTLFAPRHQPGIVILFDVDAPATMRIFVRFRPDLNLMWPGGIGGQSYEWDEEHKWLKLAEPTNRFTGLIGSPFAVSSNAAGYVPYLSNEQPYNIMELSVTPDLAKKYYIPLIVVGGIGKAYDAEAIYSRLLADFANLYTQSLQHYQNLDSGGPQFLTPDAEVNESLRWSRVALDQLKVCNPFVGCSYVSGYGSSGTGTRPMYAWFFEEPAITSWAYLDAGESAGLKEALIFLQKYQRSDGAIPHEISQSAGLIGWFKQYPYAYIHADSTFWYLIAMAHFYDFTGDTEFVKQNWASIQHAYEYGRTMVDPADGLPVLRQGEWGSMEVAGFVKDAGLAGGWIAALRAVAKLSKVAGQTALSAQCEEERSQAAAAMEREFWNPQLDYYNYGLSASSQPVTYLNSAIGYSAWLGSLPDNHLAPVLERLSTAAFLADWGERNMSLADSRYEEGDYHVGSAWPFLTAAPMLAEFQHHDAIQAYATWREMLELRHFDARGAIPEALTGTHLRLLEDGVPHQMFSELTAIPGLIEGVLGMDLDVPHHILHWSPHLPPNWPQAGVQQFPFGQSKLDLQLTERPGQLTASLSSTTGLPILLRFSPALPAGARVLSVRQNGKAVRFSVKDNGSDVHVILDTKFAGSTKIEVRYAGGIGIVVRLKSLQEGDRSRNLHVLHTEYAGREFFMTVEGRPEENYQIQAYTPWRLTALAGATVPKQESGVQILVVSAPQHSEKQMDRAGYVRWTVRLYTSRKDK